MNEERVDHTKPLDDQEQGYLEDEAKGAFSAEFDQAYLRGLESRCCGGSEILWHGFATAFRILDRKIRDLKDALAKAEMLKSCDTVLDLSDPIMTEEEILSSPDHLADALLKMVAYAALQGFELTPENFVEVALANTQASTAEQVIAGMARAGLCEKFPGVCGDR